MRIAEIDVHDDAQLEAFWSAAKEGDEFERPYALFWSLPAAAIAFRSESNSFERDRKSVV